MTDNQNNRHESTYMNSTYNNTPTTFIERRIIARERRNCIERRKADTPVANDKRRRQRRQNVVDRRLGLDRCRGPGHRLTEERKAAEEGQMTDEQFEFLMAIEQYKKENQRPFPTWTEVLEVITAMGYRKVAQPQSLKSFKKEKQPVAVS